MAGQKVNYDKNMFNSYRNVCIIIFVGINVFFFFSSFCWRTQTQAQGVSELFLTVRSHLKSKRGKRKSFSSVFPSLYLLEFLYKLLFCFLAVLLQLRFVQISSTYFSNLVIIVSIV